MSEVKTFDKFLSKIYYYSDFLHNPRIKMSDYENLLIYSFSNLQIPLVKNCMPLKERMLPFLHVHYFFSCYNRFGQLHGEVLDFKVGENIKTKRHEVLTSRHVHNADCSSVTSQQGEHELEDSPWYKDLTQHHQADRTQAPTGYAMLEIHTYTQCWQALLNLIYSKIVN